MTKIIVDIPGEKPYDVRVESGIVSQLGETLRSFTATNHAMIITDSAVEGLYGQSVEKVLEEQGFETVLVAVPHGESAKSLEVAGEIWDAMAAMHLNRDSIIVALGGGVVGDLAGFTGSTFMRGLPIVQVPTTLLSMVDSSVGGKTAINLDAGKNLVGTFCQPRYVCADIDLLNTLPEREWICGCGEIAKSAVIDSREFFEWLNANAQLLCERNADVVKDAVVKCIAFKARVVVEDKAETKGVRECLNYGHTLAHAIETAAGYGVYSHGACVAQGMRFAARLGTSLVGTPLAFITAQDELFDVLSLDALEFKADPEELLRLMMSDKKVRSDSLRFVLPRDFGQWSVETVSPEIVLEHLQAWQASLV